MNKGDARGEKHVYPECPEELDTKLEQFRCGECGRVLALVGIVEGTIAIKCKKCREWNVLDVRSIDVVSSGS